MREFIDIVFDGPPDHDAPRFVEVEDEQGRSIDVGIWINRPGTPMWALRLYPADVTVDPARSCTQPDIPMIQGIRADRPQAADAYGKGLTFEVAEFGGECPDMMPQAVTVTDKNGRSAVYGPLPPSRQPQKSNIVQFTGRLPAVD